jgi:hypothetical protein
LSGASAHGFALWLLAEGEPQRRLQAAVDRIARGLGTPPFTPHVTLLVGFTGDPAELSARAARLAAVVPQVEVRVVARRESEAYFKSAFLEVDGGAALIEARQRAEATLGSVPGPAYEPHLSVLYSSLPPAVRQRALAMAAPDVPATLTLSRLELWSVEGEVQAWRLVSGTGLGAARD